MLISVTAPTFPSPAITLSSIYAVGILRLHEIEAISGNRTASSGAAATGGLLRLRRGLEVRLTPPSSGRRGHPPVDRSGAEGGRRPKPRGGSSAEDVR